MKTGIDREQKISKDTIEIGKISRHSQIEEKEISKDILGMIRHMYLKTYTHTGRETNI